MELGNDIEKQFQNESVWIPQTPAKSTPARLNCEDISSVGTVSSEAFANEHHELDRGDEKAMNEDSKGLSDEAVSLISLASTSMSTPSKKVSIIIKRKGKKKRRYRPKVILEGKIKKKPKPKALNPLTPKPRTPKPPKCRTSEKILGTKSDNVTNNILKASNEASKKTSGNKSDIVLDNIVKTYNEPSRDGNFDFSQGLDERLGVSPHISTEAICPTVVVENCDCNTVEKNCQEALSPPAEECGDINLVEFEPEVVSGSCRRSLNFNLLLEDDLMKNSKDSNASCSTMQRGESSSQMLVYQRRSKKLDLQNRRKSGPDFPSIFRKQRTRRTSSFITIITSLLAVGRQNEMSLNSVIAAKDMKLNIVKKRRMGRNKRMFPTLPSVLGTDGEKICEEPGIEQSREQPSSSHETPERRLAKDIVLNSMKKKRKERSRRVFPILPSVLGTCGEQFCEESNIEQSWEQNSSSHGTPRRQLSLFPLEQTAVVDPKSTNKHMIPLLSTTMVRRNNAPKLYRGNLVPRFFPPRKKLRLLEDVIKKLQHLHIGDIIKRPSPIKKKASAVGKNPGELVLYGLKKQVPKVFIDQKTEREWNLLLQVFNGGADEERGEDTDKWWEEQRRIFRVRTLTFVAIMHIIQGDRRFSEWKGSVVDSVVGVFLTQNVSDYLSSSAFMSLASKYPIKPKYEHECVNFCCTETTPIVQEFEPESGDSRTKNHPVDWDELRKTYGDGTKGETSGIYSDSVDWEAVRLAPPEDIADAIKMRGQHVVIGAKIQAFLNRLVKDHGSVDLEWLRNVPPDTTKAYLLSFYGLGLKSVECIRLLCLHHHAFPVDINVARVAVRLGWVPLQPLPGDVQFHLLNEYPIMDTVQVYLWPRLCSLDQKTLYELHYQMITFGKVFCKKRNPSCGTCPMRGECRHYASQVASSRPSLPTTREDNTSNEIVSISSVDDSLMVNATTTRSVPQSSYQRNNVDPIIELPPSPVNLSNTNLVRDIEDWFSQNEEEDIPTEECNVNDGEIPSIKLGTEEWNVNDEEIPSTKLGTEEWNVNDEEIPSTKLGTEEWNVNDEEIPSTKLGTEEWNVNDEEIPSTKLGTEEWNVNDEEIPSIKLGTEEWKKRFREAMRESDIVLPEDDVSKALIALTSGASSIPTPKLKNIGRLKTVHHVYELPDCHPILAGVQSREPDDPSPYLLVIWASDGDVVRSQPFRSQPFRSQSCSQRLELKDVEMPCSTDSTRSMEDKYSDTVPGTLMIPCRTANKGRFPLNGTYFQVNEVFADDESAEHPIQVPRHWLWNLRRRFLYCGSSASAIFTGIPIEEIQHCFWRGFICVRAFNRKTRAAVELPEKFHQLTAHKSKGKGKRKFTVDEKDAAV